MTILPTNITQIEEISSYDSNGAIIFIVGVLIWYALGFGLILIDDLNASSDRRPSGIYSSVSQTVSDLNEQQDRNDILVELKDKDRRMRLWQIYYGTSKNHPITMQKDEEAVGFIIKQLNELNERRRTLRHSLHAISIDQVADDDSDNDSYYSSNIVNNQNDKSIEQFQSYFK